ncbi:TetR/AcrR family transcriptional regulator [Herbiconiux daphne]|uniref:TetR/AcrR family transcriptional regulator n=1 Tax=Herbiconiux daphne TaxID=2970914 RepID=A0ABT2H708_9MICO|nr:TetR/AcrR family transcriptional regulator [Herbiconiux daphne]MCS5735694.1 TetR/AcrR family transcriptional regulator [Herbiconiux daphne]
MTSSSPGTERAPQQDRSRDSWERALRVGMELFEEGGSAHLTINEVCRRAAISAPSLYARVDGKSGLLAAVHRRWLDQFALTEDELIAQHVRPHATVEHAAAAAARVIIGVFRAHERALKALIERSAYDSSFLQRGSRASQGLVQRLAATLPVDSATATSAVRVVYAENVLRVMYGPSFLADVPETDQQFEIRVVRLAQAVAAVIMDSSVGDIHDDDGLYQ